MCNGFRPLSLAVYMDDTTRGPALCVETTNIELDLIASENDPLVFF